MSMTMQSHTQQTWASVNMFPCWPLLFIIIIFSMTYSNQVSLFSVFYSVQCCIDKHSGEVWEMHFTLQEKVLWCQISPWRPLLALWAELSEGSVTGAAHSTTSIMYELSTSLLSYDCQSRPHYWLKVPCNNLSLEQFSLSQLTPVGSVSFSLSWIGNVYRM